MKYSIVTLFLVFIFGLSFNHMSRYIDKIDANENRKLAEWPEFDVNRLDYYPNKFETYFNDNFGGRAYFVDFYLWLNKHVLKKKTVAKSYILGDDNFIFEMKKNLPVYIGERTVSDEELEQISIEFKKRQEYFDQLGIKMYIQIIPSKFKVYSNKLPLLITKDNKHMGDRFVKYFRQNTTIPIVDGTDILIAKRNTENVYLKYDTHWSGLGSFYVYKALFDTMRIDFPELAAFDTSNFTIKSYAKEGGNMKWVAPDKSDPDFGFEIKPKHATFYKAEGYVHKMEDFRYGQESYCIRYQSKHEKAPKVLVIRDSFGDFTLSYLPEMFSETLYIWDDWKYKFNKEIVDIEKPDAIVYTFYEGYIDRLLMEPSFVKSNLEAKDIQ